MSYSSLKSCIEDLERHGHLVRVTEEVDPHLEMASIQLRVYEAGGPAIFFENVKGTSFPAVSNLFGTLERSTFMFRDTIEKVKKMIQLKADPTSIMRNPMGHAWLPFAALNALPRKARFRKPIGFNTINISELPQIKHWPMDGGPFVTLPAVYTEDMDKPGVMQSNLGMYRIQLGGNDYVPDKEIGLHYQLHRGIGIHQTKANAKGQPLKVSIFVGGPPANIFSAVMPLPEGISELTFAGTLGGRRFRYYYDEEGFCLSADADFVITGEVYPGENKPEGPFGDHLGYYSLKHDFPLMKVKKVYHRKGAIWPFTVVGRPPQEDTSFGALIHEITGDVIPNEIPGVHEVHAVDAAGVHPLLLAIGSERYTPYYKDRQPKEVLTIANHILGTGQMSLAKFLFITDKEDDPKLHTHDVAAYFKHVLQRIDWRRDVHFHTKTSIDTLDYSGTGLNSGSKAVFAAVGPTIRTLSNSTDGLNDLPDGFSDPAICLPGVIAIKGNPFIDQQTAARQMDTLSNHLKDSVEDGVAMIVICDDSDFAARTLNNWVWITFTRSNPSHDIYGVDAFTEHKHWGCNGPLIIDARIKPHHAPPLILDPDVEKRVDRVFAKGGSLSGLVI
ncbi:MAG: UbiD family decarboxylase [Bacteroidetes bacterium]|nr:UbiD family decarboxylase [Bacteroidota bacterium]